MTVACILGFLVGSLALVLQVLHVILNLERAVGELGDTEVSGSVVGQLEEANLVTVDYVLGVELAVGVTIELSVAEDCS